MYKLKICCIVLFVFALNVKAEIIELNNCVLDSVQDAISNAQSGDTIVLPSCTSVWTSQLIIDKELCFKGQGLDNTILINANPDNYTGIVGVSIDVDTEESTHISGITFRSDRVNSKQYHITVRGDEEYQIDSCKFVGGMGYLSKDIAVFGYNTAGVIYNCIFDSASIEAILVRASNQIWLEDPTLGSEKATFVENCLFVNSPGGHAITSEQGAKTVFRYNDVHDTDIDVHGHCFNQGMNSARHYEIYENDIYSLGSSYRFGMYIRGGTGVIFNNRLHESGISGGFHAEIALTDYRATANCPNDGCGTEGYPLYDQIGRGKNQESEPLYLWNNRIDENNDGIMNRDAIVMVREAHVNDCDTLPTTYYIKNESHGGEINPDYYNDGRQMPNYISYPYPHPLRESLVTSISNTKEQSMFELKQNYPNPFSNSTTIDIYISEIEDYTLNIIDLNGREVAILFDGYISTGKHSFVVQTSNVFGNYSNGVYFYQLSKNNVILSTKMMIYNK